jgi:hypothetical protein
MTDLTKIISDMNHFLNQSTAQVNQFFVKKFGRAITGDTIGNLSIDQAEGLAATKAVVLSSLSTFNQPSFVPTTLYQFNDLPIRLIAKIAYNGVEETEVSLEVDEVVDSIDTTCAEYWMVRKADGQEGFVPATALRPLPIEPRSKRMTLIAGQGGIPPWDLKT